MCLLFSLLQLLGRRRTDWGCALNLVSTKWGWDSLSHTHTRTHKHTHINAHTYTHTPLPNVQREHTVSPTRLWKPDGGREGEKVGGRKRWRKREKERDIEWKRKREILILQLRWRCIQPLKGWLKHSGSHTHTDTHKQTHTDTHTDTHTLKETHIDTHKPYKCTYFTYHFSVSSSETQNNRQNKDKGVYLPSLEMERGEKRMSGVEGGWKRILSAHIPLLCRIILISAHGISLCWLS